MTRTRLRPNKRAIRAFRRRVQIIIRRRSTITIRQRATRQTTRSTIVQRSRVNSTTKRLAKIRARVRHNLQRLRNHYRRTIRLIMFMIQNFSNIFLKGTRPNVVMGRQLRRDEQINLPLFLKINDVRNLRLLFRLRTTLNRPQDTFIYGFRLLFGIYGTTTRDHLEDFIRRCQILLQFVTEHAAHTTDPYVGDGCDLPSG